MTKTKKIIYCCISCIKTELNFHVVLAKPSPLAYSLSVQTLLKRQQHKNTRLRVFCKSRGQALKCCYAFNTHLFDLQQPSWVLTPGPPSCSRRFVVGDGDDVAGRGRVAQVPLRTRG